MTPRVVVVGAGAFGGWSALHLVRAGARVTLVDAWGPGNSRSSSGDETRVIRGSYGPNAIYTEMTARSLPMWKDNQRKWGARLLRQNGALWMAPEADDTYERASVENIRACGMPLEIVERREAEKRWPQMSWEGLRWALFEPEGGFLMARRACQAVMEGFVAEGGTYVQAQVSFDELERFEADQYVLACGPWLSDFVTPTRQQAIYFGTPAGDASFNEDRFPAWVDNSQPRHYGIPGNDWRGFKVARDVPGEPFDPSDGDRRVTDEAVQSMRAYLAARYPALKDAPVVETRVCQYEMSADGGLIVDRHPAIANAWVVGGGSGHGFKFSPALGEHVAELVLGKRDVEPRFALARFKDEVKGKVGERK